MFLAWFSAHTDSDLAQSFTFHHEFEPTSMICELSLSMVNENDDEAGSALWFSSYTYEDDDGTPHDVNIDYSAGAARIGHNMRMEPADLERSCARAVQRVLLGFGFVTGEADEGRAVFLRRSRAQGDRN